ncbi:MAG TPA: nucleoside deaminase [Candidatus Bathyarchaeia archaeon]|nr:nucleoside deaminase [Candidatus Bathyarchaeia archaeon]
MKFKDKKFLNIVVEQARESVKQGGFPAGAVIVKNGKIISKGVSLGFKLSDPTSHAETASIREACRRLKTVDLSGATLYASLQPCLMCFSVANWAGISKIVYGCKKTDDMVSKEYYEGKTDINEVNKQNNRQINLTYILDFEDEILKLVKNWEKQLK